MICKAETGYPFQLIPAPRVSQNIHKNPVLSDFLDVLNFLGIFGKESIIKDHLCVGYTAKKDEVKRVRCRGPEGTKTSSILILQTLDMICLIYLDVFLYCRDWIYFDWLILHWALLPNCKAEIKVEKLSKNIFFLLQSPWSGKSYQINERYPINKNTISWMISSKRNNQQNPIKLMTDIW